MRGRILVQQLAEVLSLEIMRLPANLDASGFKVAYYDYKKMLQNPVLIIKAPILGFLMLPTNLVFCLLTVCGGDLHRVSQE